MLLDSLSNEQAIVLVLLGFYLYESLAWLPSGATAFVSRWGRQYSPLPGCLFDVGDKGGFGLGNLLPTASTFVTRACPVKLAPTGLLSDAGFHSYESLGEVAFDHSVVLSDDRPLCTLASPLAARALAELIKDLAASPPRDREETIERWLSESTDER